MGTHFENRQKALLASNTQQPGKAQPKPIQQYSQKRKKLNQQYAEVSRPKWQGQQCAIRSPVCTLWADGWNHADGKENAEKLLDVENGQPACNPCNEYCESHHEWAVEYGFRGKRNQHTNRFDNTFKK